MHTLNKCAGKMWCQNSGTKMSVKRIPKDSWSTIQEVRMGGCKNNYQSSQERNRLTKAHFKSVLVECGESVQVRKCQLKESQRIPEYKSAGTRVQLKVHEGTCILKFRYKCASIFDQDV